MAPVLFDSETCGDRLRELYSSNRNQSICTAGKGMDEYPTCIYSTVLLGDVIHFTFQVHSYTGLLFPFSSCCGHFISGNMIIYYITCALRGQREGWTKKCIISVVSSGRSKGADTRHWPDFSITMTFELVNLYIVECRLSAKSWEIIVAITKTLKSSSNA